MLRGTRVSVVGILGLFALLLMTAKESSASVRFTYSSGVSAEHQNLLEKDLRILSDLKFADDSGETQRLMALPELSAKEMEIWLARRARFIIDQNHPMTHNTLIELSPAKYEPAKKLGPGVSSQQKVVVQSAGGDSRTGGTKLSPVDQAQSRAGGGPVIIMANMGTAFFASGREREKLLGFQMQGGPMLALKSPRIGLLQIGRGLFMPVDSKDSDADLANFIHSVYRLGVLFHEARHGDGNGESLGMMHTPCPQGHDFQGFPACDASTNGPYRIGALFTKAIQEACGTECSLKDKEAMTVMYADSMSRLLAPVAEASASSDSSLCERLHKISPEVSFCEAASSVGRPFEVDDTPERAVESRSQIMAEAPAVM